MINLISVKAMSLAGVGAESISAPVSLADMNRADMESAPTNFDRFWVQMVIKYNMDRRWWMSELYFSILIYLCFPLRHALTWVVGKNRLSLLIRLPRSGLVPNFKIR